MIRIVAISDTHMTHGKIKIPECDILIHAGDMTHRGEHTSMIQFARWMDEQPAKEIICIPGNHELHWESNYDLFCADMKVECPNLIILNDSGVYLNGIKFWGSPITPWFHSWAWNRHRGDEIKKHWDMIPEDTNILITHGPPFGILDGLVRADGTPRGDHVGCRDLLERIDKVKPDLHFFGHIHAHGGQQVHSNGTSFYNASICDEIYYPSNPITIVEYEKNR